MTAAAVLRAASRGVSHRLVQTVVVFVLLAAASAAALLGLALLTNANEAFSHGFAAHHGADVWVTIDSAKATPAQLAATSQVPGVTRAAGPYATVTVRLAPASSSGQARSGTQGSQSGRGPGSAGGRGSPGHGSPAGTGGPALMVIGRASPGGPLDDLALQSGHWLTGPGQIVLGNQIGPPFPAGSKVIATSAPGKPQLTVAGTAGSSGAFGEDGWVTPSEAAALRPKGAPATVEMLYTFTKAGTARQIGADVAALKAALPAGTVTGYDSWLVPANLTSTESGINTPFVVAFTLIALVLAVLIVASVVSGAVVAGYRRIGVLKSIGFTPLQVAVAYTAQIGVPALAGVAAGTVAGNLWVTPMLNFGANLFKAGAQHVPLWINLAVPAGMCVLAGLAALVPALRAGRLSAVQAIAAGQAPRAGHGYGAHRLASRLPLPRPVTVGLAAPFTRPSRAAATLAAILFGIIAVILAVGLYSSLAKVYQISNNLGEGQVQAGPAQQFKNGSIASMTTSQSRALAAAIGAQPGTEHYVAQAIGGDQHPKVTMPGLPTTSADGLAFRAYNGDSAWLGYQVTSGRWYNAPGEVDVNASFLTEAGLKVGDRFTFSVNGKPVTARITGQVYYPNTPFIFTGWQTLGGAAAGLAAQVYDIGLKPGISPHAYAKALRKALRPGFSVSFPSGGAGISGLVDKSLIQALTALVIVLAGLGVLNSVLMAARERVHDLGIFKALGMTPGQAIVMVGCWVIAPAIAAAVIATPAGITAHSLTVQAIGGSGLPASVIAIYQPAELALLAASALVIAAVGALGPASWAAAARTVTALRAE
jgi:putative ABC transport system permease protein